MSTRKTRKPQRPKEELLKPPNKMDGVPEVSLSELVTACQSGEKLWMGCKGRIFDVGATEEGKEFYGQGGGYSLFVGKDASVALGKMKFNPEYLDPTQLHWSRDMDEKELNILEEWVEKFEGKYPVVGYIKDDGIVAP